MVNYLSRSAPTDQPACDPGHYYLLNNYNPGFNRRWSTSLGTLRLHHSAVLVRHIGDALMEKNISFKYYGDGWNIYLSPTRTSQSLGSTYCIICNPFQYATDIMTNATLRRGAHSGRPELYEDIKATAPPAVSIVKPERLSDGHPASSKLDLFEASRRISSPSCRRIPTLWANTAVFVTFDEGGGYYDSGYIQPLDFFGDGTRIPLLIVSPFTTAAWSITATPTTCRSSNSSNAIGG